jgi:HlyD family secretion protein
MKQAIETAKVQVQQAHQTLARQEDLWRQQLTTREALERATNDVKAAESNLREREKQLSPQSARIMQERAVLESARYDLSKNRIESPIDGIVTRRNIRKARTAVVGTMNNAGTVLLTLADMGIIQAEVEVDETNVPNVQIGQPAKITIDAIPEKSFRGHVTEIGNSPIQTTGAQANTQATNFKGGGDARRTSARGASRFHLHGRHHDRRPARTSCRCRFPAVAVRELVYDGNGQIVKEPKDEKRRRPSASTVETSVSAQELKPGRRARKLKACS